MLLPKYRALLFALANWFDHENFKCFNFVREKLRDTANELINMDYFFYKCYSVINLHLYFCLYTPFFLQNKFFCTIIWLLVREKNDQSFQKQFIKTMVQYTCKISSIIEKNTNFNMNQVLLNYFLINDILCHIQHIFLCTEQYQ